MLIQSLHDPPTYGHPGISRTMDFVEQSYWWPGLHRDVADYVQGCGECQCHKVNNCPTRAPLQPIHPTMDVQPFEVVAMVPSWCASYHAAKQSWWRQLLNCFWTLFSSITVSLTRSLVTKTLDSHPSSPRNYVMCWGSNRTYLLHTTPGLMDSPSETING